MLEEVEEFVSKIVFSSDNETDKLSRILNNWKNRLQSTQVHCTSVVLSVIAAI